MKAPLLASTAALLTLAPQPHSPAKAGELLAPSEMAEIVGGGTVATFFDPADGAVLEEDNPLIELDIVNSVEAPFVWLFDNGEPMQVVPVEPGIGEKTIKMRAHFPIDNDSHTLSLKYFDPSDSQLKDMEGDSVRTGLRLSDDLQVAKVKFYQLQEPGGANPTTLPDSWIYQAIDNPGESHDWRSAASSDAIMTQCPANKRWNFRFAGLYRETVPAGCTEPHMDVSPFEIFGINAQDLAIFLAAIAGVPYDLPTNPTCLDYGTIFTNMINARAAAEGFDPDDFVHVVIVNGHRIWNGQSYVGQGGFAAPGTPFVLVSDVMPSAHKFASVLAHELSHRQLNTFCHVDQDPESDVLCQLAPLMTGESEFDPGHDCDTDDDQNKNLMCSSSGRELTPSQCERLHVGTGFLKDAR